MGQQEFLENFTKMPWTDQCPVAVLVDGQKLKDDRFEILEFAEAVKAKSMASQSSKPILIVVSSEKFRKLDLNGLGALVFRN